MKKIVINLLVISVVILQGCAVKSLHPFYEKEDVIFLENLLGNWIDNDSLIWQINHFKSDTNNPVKKFTKNNTSYLISLVDQKEGTRDLYCAHLFMLNDEYYIDLQSLDEDTLIINTKINAHVLAKVKINTNTIQLFWYNDSWLELLINDNKDTGLKYEKIDDNSYVLTSSTEELHQFIKKYGGDPRAFKANFEAFESDRQKDTFIMNLSRILPYDSLHKKQSGQN